MVIVGMRFNTYLRTSLVLALLCGCQSPESKSKSKKQLSIVGVHLEAIGQDSTHNEKVPIYREHPIMLNILIDPFLTQSNIKKASVVDSVGGFGLRLEFDHRGSQLLEQYTAGNIGKHLAIAGEFMISTNSTVAEKRWLAAPRITRRINDGALLFTPDATRDEAERFANGLNNVAKELGQKTD